MNQFDVFEWRPPQWPAPPPCVVNSHPDRVARKDPVEVVMCSTKRAGRAAENNEIILDREDGLDWPTLCKCDVIYAVPKADLKKHRGAVTRERRSQLVRRIIAAHGWATVA